MMNMLTCELDHGQEQCPLLLPRIAVLGHLAWRHWCTCPNVNRRNEMPNLPSGLSARRLEIRFGVGSVQPPPRLADAASQMVRKGGRSRHAGVGKIVAQPGENAAERRRGTELRHTGQPDGRHSPDWL